MNPPDKDPQRIAAMFSAIAPRYDRANHILSFNQDRRWRRFAVRQAELCQGMRVLDLCTGTGDLALALARAAPVEVVGLDLSRDMLARAREKARRAGLEGRVRFLEGNALDVPFPSERFDRVTIAFGLRNLPDYRAGLAEIVRVLRPGGRALILEFARPAGLWGRLYELYLRHLLPVLGGWLTGRGASYRYLHDSIRAFPDGPSLAALLRAASLAQVEVFPLSGGIVLLHRGVKP